MINKRKKNKMFFEVDFLPFPSEENKKEILRRAEELFNKWKNVVKKGKFSIEDFALTSAKKEQGSDQELLKKTALIFKTQPEFVPKTARRFLEEIKHKKIN